ncbi:expressed unknown protein [Seminavis robusta]|uniref:Uncharacterized protein n=1 Tax=Seminavis robusta TaxID=568900 RepID=A0A9N8DCR2_9STRA|nr:expressed unknown protein [Seminavis robusta]|eukprot:Sro63_g035890.1 n/a (218) ;mRNA; f:80642-81295
MKISQTLLLVLTTLVAVWAQEEHHQEQHHHEAPPPPNCDAICEEKVRQAVQPVQDEKVRAEEWGHGVKRELDEAYNKLRAAEGQVEQLRNQLGEQERRAADFERSSNDLRGNLENTQRDLDGSRRELEGARRELDQMKHDHQVEVEDLRTKTEESTRSLGRIQFALDEAHDQVKEMESARVTVNLKGIADDVKVYWKNLLTWWTGLVMPDKKNDEDL